MITAGQVELEQIRDALRRMDGDEYGTCQGCGEEIPVARLRIVPTTTLCRDCAP